MLYKRGSIYWARLTGPDGKEIRRSTGTQDRQRAQEWHDRVKASLWDQKRLGIKPSRSWQEAVVRWIDERDTRAATLENDLSNARVLDEFLGKLDLNHITADCVNGIAAELRKRGNKPGTINARLAFIRAILRRAAGDWQWIDAVPRFRRLKAAEPRLRWLTRDEADRLLSELPGYLAAQMRFTLATGLRAGNVRGLEWKDVDMGRRIAWVRAENAKGRKSIGVPLNNDACVVIREQEGKHPRFVFTRNGEPCGEQGGREWRAAVARAGVEPLRWHDLRHTWASWHVQAGTPLTVLRELGGWSKFETVLIYAHLAPEHLAEHAGNIDTLRPRKCTKMAQ